ncbi:putative 2-dehydropantoate 2-reductase [Curvularia clavata]|uniref:2-dehydropantoate 2-reductase n=1 Tax=Curvularia clavata TaxID=95742 RepID=A0A9Q8ZIG6_CURCL|nr:putative 2-dehydropantoate 2-reductase [Curvularia clavata]
MTSWRKEESASTEETANAKVDSEPAAPLPSRNTADFYRTKPVMDRRIHIMGMGNVGSFVAHALRGIPNPPPVSLIFPRWERLKEWNDSPQKLTLITDGDVEAQEGYDAELAVPRIRYHGKEVGLDASSTETAGDVKVLEGESTEPISSLIICSKAPYVLQGLSSVKHRLNKDSVVLFMQNGMGIVEEVNREIFPDPATRPHYMLGINSHGMHASPDSNFTTVHAGFGTISLGILPHERDRKPDSPYIPQPRFTAPKDSEPVYQSPPDELNPEYPPPSSAKFPWTPNQRHLLRTLLRAPVLSAASFSPPDLLQMQLDKLAVNCIINPLTVLIDARNGAILNNYALTRTMRLLLSEISLVIRSLPELQYIPNVQQRFDPGRLETVVVSVANLTRDNVSSMLADTRKGMQTEIDYINGWVVKRGEELGIRCAMNYMLVQLVKGKRMVVQHELEGDVPLVQPKRGRAEGGLTVREGR